MKITLIIALALLLAILKIDKQSKDVNTRWTKVNGTWHQLYIDPKTNKVYLNGKLIQNHAN